MAYVRKRGKQLVIVHGVRAPETRKVEQQILFTLYSKGEALEALGRSKGGGERWFCHILEERFPQVRFDWQRIHRGIEENLAVLPDFYDFGAERLRGSFRQDLARFTKQLCLADPQSLVSLSRLIDDHRCELEFLRELLDWRLGIGPQEPSEWNQDNPFHWRYLTQSTSAPAEVEGLAQKHYADGDYARARAVFRLLIECFDNYAEGYNYLGLIDLHEQRYDAAIDCFRKTMAVGRRLFPKRIAKQRWWGDDATRPYMRGLRNLALTLNQAGRHIEALRMCEQLEHECGDDISAAAHRAEAYLATEQWQLALEAALRIHRISAGESVLAALAAYELGRHDQARALFLHAVLNAPRTVAMVVDKRLPAPRDFSEAQDHNGGIHLSRSIRGFLDRRSRSSKQFFSRLWTWSAPYRAELAEVTRQWRETRRSEDRSAFDRMSEMQSLEFAEREAAEEVVSRASA